MVKKLYKHEFIALGRMFLPLYGICIAIAGVFSLSIVWSSRSDGNTAAMFTNAISGFGFTMAMLGLAILTAALLIMRFYKCFAKSEGYLTMSLPVEVNTHIVCKLVCAIVFEALAVIVALLSLGIVFAGAGFADDIWELRKEGFNALSVLFEEGFLSAKDAVVSVIQLVLVLILSAVQGLLMPYAAISMGQKSSKKLGMSVLWYFIFNTVLQAVSGIVSSFMETSSYEIETAEGFSVYYNLNFSVPMWISIALVAVSSLVLYIITRHNLKHSLNLE